MHGHMNVKFIKITPTLWKRVKNNQLLGCRKVYYRIQSHASSPDLPKGLLLFKDRFATSDHAIHLAVFQIQCNIMQHATFYAKGSHLHLNPMLEDHTTSAVRDLFIQKAIFTVTIYTGCSGYQ
jgi:hypothetical protein